jgi:hypothetical protein
VDRIFWVTCPRCEHSFSVDYGIRYAEVLLECPWCRNKFAVDEAASLDERWVPGA